MRQEDLQLITDLGRALYANPELARSKSVETVAAVSTLEQLSDDQVFEKVTYLLLKQAEQEGTRASSAGVTHPFYRLSSLDRGVLALLHSGRVSYKRLARVLSVDPIMVEQLAWSARTKLASAPEVRRSAPHPVGTSKLKHACPEYFPDHPWTQKLLDDEMKPQELVMIQNHTMVCEECRRALVQAREFYYAVEQWVPTVNEGVSVTVSELREARIRLGKLPLDLTVLEALKVVFRRNEIRIAIGVLFITLLVKVFLK